MKNYYDILEVSKSAKKADIHKAFRTLAQKYHPDTADKSTADADMFKDVNEAYAVLKDDAKRSKYDEKLEVHETKFAPQKSRNEKEYLTPEEIRKRVYEAGKKRIAKESHFGMREFVFLFRVALGLVFGVLSVFSYERMVESVPLEFYPFGAFLGTMGVLSMSTPTPVIKKFFQKMLVRVEGVLYIFATFFGVFFGSIYGQIIAFEYGLDGEYLTYGIITVLTTIAVWIASTDAFLKKLLLPRTYKSLLSTLGFISMVHVSFVLIAIYFETVAFDALHPYFFTTLGFVLSNFVVYFGHFDRVKKRSLGVLLKLVLLFVIYIVLTYGFFFVYYEGDFSLF
jgi:hypothetical protein